MIGTVLSRLVVVFQAARLAGGRRLADVAAGSPFDKLVCFFKMGLRHFLTSSSKLLASSTWNGSSSLSSGSGN